MKLTKHPEYQTYFQDKQTTRRCREAVTAWATSGESLVVETYTLRWTYEGAQAFVRSLAHLFREYNRVLWERFAYCRGCGGQCCVLDATHVAPFDAFALALLDRSLPTLPEEITASARDCIYHTVEGCAWPTEWRPIKCWSFYCALGEPTNAIAAELERVVLALLPDALRRYEEASGNRLVDHLGDPVDFAEAFSNALSAVFVVPFNHRYLMIDQAASIGEVSSRQ
jgi:hypothetical protein